MFRRVAAQTGCPLSFTLLQVGGPDPGNWKTLLESVAQGNAEGHLVTGQVFARPLGVMLGLDASFHPFTAFPSYQAIAHLPLAEQVVQMRKPEVRAAILSEQPDHGAIVFSRVARLFDTIFPLGEKPDYEPDPSTSVAAVAAARGLTPDEAVYDLLLEDDGHALLLQTAANYVDRNLDAVHEMLTHPNTVPALGDGGAHYGTICDSTYTTFLLTHWGRDRARGRIPTAELIRLMTTKPAAMLGLRDRGRIAPGLKADLNVIDLGALTLRAPRMVRDLPSGGRRLTQDAEGYRATVVSGQVIQRGGRPTGALPGRMVERSARAAPTAMAAE